MQGGSGSGGDPPPQVLAGLVERVTFRGEETGFAVLRLRVAGQRDLATQAEPAHRDAHQRRKAE